MLQVKLPGTHPSAFVALGWEKTTPEAANLDRTNKLGLCFLFFCLQSLKSPFKQRRLPESCSRKQCQYLRLSSYSPAARKELSCLLSLASPAGGPLKPGFDLSGDVQISPILSS